jgi:carboxyl-terminal processing protease
MTFHRNHLYLALLLALVLVAGGLSSVGNAKVATANAELSADSIKPEIRHARTAEEILLKLQYRHYEKRPFDDSLSSALLDSYLGQLDPSKQYFLQADIDEFNAYRFTLDDGIRRGNLKPGFLIFNRYRDRSTDYLTQTLADLDQRIAQLDFSRDESILLESEQLPWPDNTDEAQDRSRKALKNAVLSLQLADKTPQEIIETLQKRYQNQLNRLQQFNAEDVFELYMNSLMALYDPHSGYMSPRVSENFSINMSLSLEGIGAVLSTNGEYTEVERLIKGGPAELHGDLQPNDKIIGVGQGKDSAVEDVVGWRLDEVVELIRGKKDTAVTLEVISGDSAANHSSKRMTIIRNKVKLEEQAAQKDALDILHNDKLHKVGVVQVPTFYHDYEGQMRGDSNYRSTTRDVKKLIEELDSEGVEGIIVDLRGNGGGYLEEARTLTGLFVERGPVVQIRMANGKIKSESNYPNNNYYKKPIVVLVDRLSASASEIFAGAIQDYQRGLIIGGQSFGKGTVQQVTALNHGALKLTEAKYYRISGESTQHRGVIPDVKLPSIYDYDEIGESTLDHALSWDTIKPLRHKKYSDYQTINTQLLELHQQRIENDPDYQYLNQQISLNEKYDDLTSLSLNAKNREELLDEHESARKTIENNRRIAKGLPLEENSDDSESEDASNEQAEPDSDTAKAEDVDPRTDFALYESANILLDTIKLSKQRRIADEKIAAHQPK